MKKIKIEYLFYLMLIISPFLDASSFLYREVYPKASFSIATIIRPIIPLILGLYIFISDKKERKKIILVAPLYLIYGLIHLYLYRNNYTVFSYGTVVHEFQYIMNYTYMIGVLYIGYYFYKNKDLKHFKKVFLIMYLSYLVLIYISILTNTSSPTYIEGIGDKGWFASGNALSSILILSLLTLLPYLFNLKNKIIPIIVLIPSWLFLTNLLGTRVGLFGFYLVILIFIGSQIFIKIIKNKKINLKKYIIPVISLVIVAFLGITIIGSKTLERRKHLQNIENNLIDPNTNDVSHVTGDIANFVYQIKNDKLDKNYMLESQQNALLAMYDWANEHKILNNNQRVQQIVYHSYLVYYQKDISLILFGNGYEINYPELSLEMELPALLYNFGLFGFILYIGPFLVIDFYGLYCLFKYIKKITIDYVIYLSASFLALALSFLAGYTFFNVSSMLVIILITILLIFELDKIKNADKKNKQKSIVFGITSLSLGGAERVLVDICNKLKDNYQITIFTLYGNGEFEKELDKKIKIIHMNELRYQDLNVIQKKKMSIYMLVPFFRYLIYKKYIKNKYDVEVSFLEGPITWLFSYNSNAKKICWVHNDISSVFGNDINSKIKKQMSKNSYIKYHKLVFVSKDNKDKFEEYMKIKTENYVIYNYLEKEKVLKKSEKFTPKELKHDYKCFVIVSRLTEQKGIDRLIDVHEKLIKDNCKHYIYHIGDGPLKEELNSKIKDRKINTFFLLGKKDNPYPYIKGADYFLLASHYEGYGMVIDEAKILNKYIMITDTAAREALKDYKNSIVVENSFDGIYNGIKKLIIDSKMKNIDYNYDNENIIEEIINLIER